VNDRPVLVAEHLSKWYGEVSGLNDVSVAIPSGVTGLLGPNGAGKSTFMKLATGQLAPSSGTIQALGEPIWGNQALYARIGYCPDQDAFYDGMTGRRWLEALVRLNGLSPADARAAAGRALALVELADAADRKIGSYSKGMRQRGKLAQAIVHDPELLILDEPLSGMDPLMRRRTIRLIKDWARAGKSVLVSSHILHEIESMTSNILLVNNGRILAEGVPGPWEGTIESHTSGVLTLDVPVARASTTPFSRWFGNALGYGCLVATAVLILASRRWGYGRRDDALSSWKPSALRSRRSASSTSG
jgi:ABC-2 type transport system ATP-binding protein